MRVLIVNAGSSSLKLSLLDGDDRALAGSELAAPRGRIDEAGLAAALGDMRDIDAVGHRIVHGGRRYVAPVRVDDEVLDGLWELADLAPLHQAKSLEALRAVSRALPGPPAVACFDTAFHSNLPLAAATYALPRDWRERFGLRRFGFHGLSHAYAARRGAGLAGRALEDLRIVSCHLGAGASLAAIQGGRSVDTTMGFTPLEGLVMATRSGSVDPGMLLWLLEHAGVGQHAMADALEHESGVAGLAGTADMKAVIARAEGGDEAARLALDVYLHRLGAGIAAMAAAMNGVDVLVLTGGVGERAPAIRDGAAKRLGFLGIDLDRDRNLTAEGDTDIGAPGAPVRTFVIGAREDLEIARQVRQVLSPGR